MQTRAALISINLFSLLCVGNSVVTVASMGSIMRYGGPIAYLIIYSFVLLAILVWVDSGTRLPRRLGSSRSTALPSGSVKLPRRDVIAEAEAASSSDDLLRVLNVSKTYQADKVVDNVSLGVSRDTIFALLGPNGAGKTTTFNMIREERSFRSFEDAEVILQVVMWSLSLVMYLSTVLPPSVIPELLGYHSEYALSSQRSIHS